MRCLSVLGFQKNTCRCLSVLGFQKIHSGANKFKTLRASRRGRSRDEARFVYSFNHCHSFICSFIHCQNVISECNISFRFLDTSFQMVSFSDQFQQCGFWRLLGAPWEPWGKLWGQTLRTPWGAPRLMANC